MKRYVALDGRGRSIITVVASDEQEAAERVREQLERPGRRFYRSAELTAKPGPVVGGRRGREGEDRAA
jgi:hypothetical protein